MEEQVRQILADVLRLGVEDIKDSTSRDNLPAWDSLRQINLVMALEEQFGVTFDVEEIESIRSFPDVVRAVRDKV